MPCVHSRCRASSTRSCRSSLPSIDMVIHHCLSSLSIMYRVLVHQLLSLKIVIVRDIFVVRAQPSHPRLPSRYAIVAVIIISFSSSIPINHTYMTSVTSYHHRLIISSSRRRPLFHRREPLLAPPKPTHPLPPAPIHHYRFISR